MTSKVKEELLDLHVPTKPSCLNGLFVNLHRGISKRESVSVCVFACVCGRKRDRERQRAEKQKPKNRFNVISLRIRVSEPTTEL